MVGQYLRQFVAVGLLALALTPFISAQEEGGRRVRSKVTPAYPELARKMNVTGTVKIEVTIAANGMVKGTKLVGGHPLLANAAMDAIKKWKFEPGEETTQVVAFNFNPTQQ